MRSVARPEVEAAWRRGVGVWVVLTLTFGGLLVATRLPRATSSPPPLDAAPGLADAAVPLDGALEACTSRSTCETQCEAGQVDACVTAADRQRTGEPAAALARYRALCRQDALACTRLALIELLSDERAYAADWVDPSQRPAARLRTACATGGARGHLACAAEVLLGAADPSVVECADADPAAEPRSCALQVARGACVDDRNPEACALAARGATTAAPASTIVEAATGVLRSRCEWPEPDRASCTYLAAQTTVAEDRDRLLLRACPEIGDGAAAACRARAALSTIPTRAAELRARACAAGWCIDQPVATRAQQAAARPVFDAACSAGRPGGCAHLLYVDRQENTGLWNRQVARAAALRPEDDPPAPAFAKVPAKVARLVTACQLGAPVACEAAGAYLAAHDGAPLAAELRALAKALRDPRPAAVATR